MKPVFKHTIRIAIGAALIAAGGVLSANVPPLGAALTFLGSAVMKAPAEPPKSETAPVPASVAIPVPAPATGTGAATSDEKPPVVDAKK